MPGVFLSYARTDGETRAADLRDRLTREAPGIRIKQDRLLLEGGTGWWKQITDAIDSVEFLILLMTPAALASGNVQKEWRYARQQGVCVYPVKGASDPGLHFANMPRWMSKSHFYDLDKEWPTFLAHLRKGCGFGKSTLAAALCHDEDIRGRPPDRRRRRGWPRLLPLPGGAAPILTPVARRSQAFAPIPPTTYVRS